MFNNNCTQMKATSVIIILSIIVSILLVGIIGNAATRMGIFTMGK